jgi:ribonuclease BN (tRNA processing enzyme)
MEAPFFPVDFSVMQAKFCFGCTYPDDGSVGSIAIETIPLNHPNGGYGYKFIEDGRSFVFLTDNELDFHHPGGLKREQYVEFCRGAEVLLHDAQYTDEDYLSKRGWGHSTYASATDLAIEAGVKQFGIFHHDPDRTDDDLDLLVAVCQQRIKEAGSKVDCFGTAEGMVLEF